MQLQEPSQSDYITLVLQSLHWLPVYPRICNEYLPNVLRSCTPSRQTRSSSDNRILRVLSKIFGQLSFFIVVAM